jgi:hypothetical protein
MVTGDPLPSTDFHLFLHQKRFLASKSFNGDDKLKDSIEKRLKPVWQPTCMNRA